MEGTYPGSKKSRGNSGPPEYDISDNHLDLLGHIRYIISSST